MKNIIKIILLFTFSNVYANNQKTLEYTALIEPSCPLKAGELEDIIENILLDVNITPIKVKK